MWKSIFFKEWIKTYRYLAAILVVSVCLYAYELSKVGIVLREMGTTYLWHLAILNNVLPFLSLNYLPVLSAALLAAAQFMPELSKKHLRLSLHLPLSERKNITIMLLFGLLSLMTIFLTCYGGVICYALFLFPSELIYAWISSSLPPLLACCTTYLGVAWILIEPTWRKRAFYLPLLLASISLFFLSSRSHAYDPILVLLVLIMLAYYCFTLLSLQRFKEGAE